MKHYTIEDAAKAYRQRIRTRIVRTQSPDSPERLTPQQLNGLTKVLAMSAERLVEQAPTILATCEECKTTVHHGVEMGGKHYCVSCVTVAAEMLKIKTKHR